MRIASFDVGIKNLAVCVMDGALDIQDWRIIPLVAKDDKVRNAYFQELADKVYASLDDCLNTWGRVDHVLIENQPVMKNPSMKTIQMLIFGFFQGARMGGRVGEIHLLSARGKLCVDNVVLCDHLKSAYANAKKSSVLTARDYLKSKGKWLATLDSSKKKDDLSDSFLQGVYFVQRCLP